MKRKRVLFALLAVCVAATAAVAIAATRDISPIPAFTNGDLTATPGDNWVTARGDVYNRQFSSLTDITASNVGQLKLAWHTRVTVPGKKAVFTGNSAEAEPVVYGGTMFMPDAKGNVFAFEIGRAHV